MTPEFVTHLIGQTLFAAFVLCAPVLVISFLVGIVINIIQVATSLQDSAFSTIPRLASFFLGFLLLMPWMLQRLLTFTASILGDLGRYAH